MYSASVGEVLIGEYRKILRNHVAEDASEDTEVEASPIARADHCFRICIACFTGFKTAQIEAIVAAMRDKGVIAGERLANWEKRQTKHERERAPDPNVAERVRRSREAKKLAAEAPEKPAVDPDLTAEPTAAQPAAPATPDEALRDVTHVTPCNATEFKVRGDREKSRRLSWWPSPRLSRPHRLTTTKLCFPE